MCTRSLMSKRTWIIFVCIMAPIGITAFALFIYGLQILPNQLPKELVPPVNLINPDQNAYSAALSQYQIKSDGFKFIMGGVGTLAGVILIFAYVACRYEIADESVQVHPTV